MLGCGCRDAGHWKEEAYSDPISVDATCDGCQGRYLAFVFHNNAHNVQLLLPITVNIDVVPWVRFAGATMSAFGPHTVSALTACHQNFSCHILIEMFAVSAGCSWTGLSISRSAHAGCLLLRRRRPRLRSAGAKEHDSRLDGTPARTALEGSHVTDS